ncbi:hypothetical protein H0H87_003018 [Tephrocybe sp. NHM501043]|nr:hypothetical protein H0H87_003018 [Tephrocybe sp. NHM501043]
MQAKDLGWTETPIIFFILCQIEQDIDSPNSLAQLDCPMEKLDGRKLVSDPIVKVSSSLVAIMVLHLLVLIAGKRWPSHIEALGFWAN